MREKLRYRWSISNNYLAGITAGMWWRLLRENGFAVDPVYWHRAAFISLASLLNTVASRKEERQYGSQIAKVRITDPPLFILGHWRSGTTLLHYLLAQDTERFAFPNTYQVVNPGSFLTTEEVNMRRFARLVPPTRPMDNMEQSFQTPQEDEFAPLLLTLRSLYPGISFPRHAARYAKYLTFRDASRSEIEQWKSAFLTFCRKLTFRYQRALLLKSPAHTARVPLLLELFPDARFVHICRNPYDVFQSQRHYFDTAIWYTYLQRPELSAIDDGILDRYVTLCDAWFQDRSLISTGRLCELRFEDLEQDPMAYVRRIYEHLGIPRSPEFEARLQCYVDSLAGYRKNTHPPLNDADRQRVAERWTSSFEAWHYPL